MTGKLVKVKRDVPYRAYTHKRLRNIPIGEGLPDIDDMREELAGYMDVLLGRKDAPVQGTQALMETADIYYARASELIMKIQQGETDGVIPKGSALTRFRTGELRTFQEIAAKAAALGSRRITALQVSQEREKTGRESTAA